MSAAKNESEAKKRSYVRKDEARLLLTQAAIELFRTRPFSHVTTKAIADLAGLSPMTIQTAFGSQLELYQEVAFELIRRVSQEFNQLEGGPVGPALLFHPDLTLSAQLVAWLKGEGLSTKAFSVEGENNFMLKALQGVADEPVDPILFSAYSRLMGYALAGFAVFAERDAINFDDIALVIGIVRSLRRMLPELQEELRMIDGRISPSTLPYLALRK